MKVGAYLTQLQNNCVSVAAFVCMLSMVTLTHACVLAFQRISRLSTSFSRKISSVRARAILARLSFHYAFSVRSSSLTFYLSRSLRLLVAVVCGGAAEMKLSAFFVANLFALFIFSDVCTGT